MGTWLSFKNSVKLELTVDKDRLNTGDYIDAKIKHTVEEILAVVPFFRADQSSTFTSGTLTVEGLASKGTMPSGAMITRADFYPTADECARRPITLYDWDQRYALTCGYECLSQDGTLFIAVDPHGASFYLYPVIDADHSVKLWWETTKANFIDSDVPSFGDESRMIEAVAFRVKSEVTREVDKDLVLAKSYFGDYLRKRTELYLDAKKRGLQTEFP